MYEEEMGIVLTANCMVDWTCLIATNSTDKLVLVVAPANWRQTELSHSEIKLEKKSLL